MKDKTHSSRATRFHRHLQRGAGYPWGASRSTAHDRDRLSQQRRRKRAKQDATHVDLIGTLQARQELPVEEAFRALDLAPHTHTSIHTTGRDKLSVEAEPDARHAVRVSRELDNRLSSVGTPQVTQVVLSSRHGDERVDGVQCDGKDGGLMLDELGKRVVQTVTEQRLDIVIPKVAFFRLPCWCVGITFVIRLHRFVALRFKHFLNVDVVCVDEVVVVGGVELLHYIFGLLSRHDGVVREVGECTRWREEGEEGRAGDEMTKPQKLSLGQGAYILRAQK